MSTVKQCDIQTCHSIKDVGSCFFKEGRRQDAAGGMEDFGTRIDLCLKCQARLLKELCKMDTIAKVASEIVQGWIKQ